MSQQTVFVRSRSSTLLIQSDCAQFIEAIRPHIITTDSYGWHIIGFGLYPAIQAIADDFDLRPIYRQFDRYNELQTVPMFLPTRLPMSDLMSDLSDRYTAVQLDALSLVNTHDHYSVFPDDDDEHLLVHAIVRHVRSTPSRILVIATESAQLLYFGASPTRHGFKRQRADTTDSIAATLIRPSMLPAAIGEYDLIISLDAFELYDELFQAMLSFNCHKWVGVLSHASTGYFGRPIDRTPARSRDLERWPHLFGPVLSIAGQRTHIELPAMEMIHRYVETPTT